MFANSAASSLASPSRHSSNLIPSHGLLQDKQYVWAGDHLLFEQFDKSVGLDVSDSRGVFMRFFDPDAVDPTRKFMLGKLQCSRFLAGARQKLWWMVPSWGKSAADIPNETQFMILRLSNPGDAKETYALILTMVSGPFRSSIRGGHKDPSSLVITIESNCATIPCSRPLDVAFVSTGSDPYKLLSEGFAAVADRVKTFNVRMHKRLPPTLVRNDARACFYCAGSVGVMDSLPRIFPALCCEFFLSYGNFAL